MNPAEGEADPSAASPSPAEPSSTEAGGWLIDDVPRRSAVGLAEPVDVGGRHRLAVAVGLIAFVAVIAFAAVGLTSLLRRGMERAEVPVVEIPRVAGTAAADAQRRLEQSGLIVDLSFAPNERLAAGTVFDQLPPAGARLERGSRVELRVSDGPFGISVPDLIGDNFIDAINELQSAGIAATTGTVYDEVAPVGAVVGTDPAVGRRVGLGASVKLTVSQGPAPRAVPQLAGRPAAEALVELGRSGMNLGEVTRTFVEGTPAGQVVSTDPAGGAMVERGAVISVVISSDPPTVTVPSVVGLLQSSAQSLLRDAGLPVGLRVVPVNDPAMTGRVVSQGVQPGAQVAGGTRVELGIGQGPTPVGIPTAGGPVGTTGGVGGGQSTPTTRPS